MCEVILEKLTMVLMQYILYDKLDFHCKKKHQHGFSSLGFLLIKIIYK